MYLILYNNNSYEFSRYCTGLYMANVKEIYFVGKNDILVKATNYFK